MNEAQPYCTLFTGMLIQESAMIVAGASTRGAVDHRVSRDGQGRPTLSGRTLAGALIASARKIFAEVPTCISSRSESDAHRPSAWRLFTTHPRIGQSTELDLRAHVAIRQDTGTQAGGRLFDTELLPRGLSWPFLLEVRGDLAGTDYLAAVRIAEEALNEWLLGRLWLGMGVARGPGWLRLSDLLCYELDSSHAAAWPNALDRHESLEDRINSIAASFNPLARPIQPQAGQAIRIGPWRVQHAGLPATGSAEQEAMLPPRRPWWFADLSARLHCGQQAPAAESFGWDAIAVGGHAASGMSDRSWLDHVARPQGQSREDFDKNCNPDHLPVMAQSCPGGRVEPIIPGSAIRGPLRHAMSRDLRQSGYRVLDPVTGQHYATPATFRELDPIAALFGTMEGSDGNASSLLVRDAHLEQGWNAAWLHHHAEDEFTQGTYARAKFDRVVVMSASFSTRLVVEAPSCAEIKMHLAFLNRVLPLLQSGHLPVGGSQWAGMGWLRWDLDPHPDAQVGPTDTTDGIAASREESVP